MNKAFNQLWLTEAVRLIEQNATPFNDASINRQVALLDKPFDQKIMKRAALISQKNGLATALERWLVSAKISVIILSVIAIFLGAAMAFTALASSPVNLLWALMSLLGVHFVTLLFWGVSFFLFKGNSQNLITSCWLFLIKKFSQKQNTAVLLPALTSLLGQKIKWCVGLIIHFVWSVILFSALIVLLALFSTHFYSFSWETTLLSPNAIVNITHYLGSIPAFFGGAVPSSDVILNSQQAIVDNEVRSVWAIWLLGVFIVYGLVIRFALMLLCLINWKRACKAVKLNTQQIEYQLLKPYLEPLVIEITDPNTAQNAGVNKVVTQAIVIDKSIQSGLVAIEVEPTWQAPSNIHFLGFLNNQTQRNDLLNNLAKNPIHSLLIAIDSNRTPDRGIINLIAQLKTHAHECRIWFICDGRQQANWDDILIKNELKQAMPDWLIKEPSC